MPKGNKLTTKEEAFCQYFSTEVDCFGNGVQAYLKAFGPKVTYKTAKSQAYRLLTKPYIINRCRKLIDTYFSNEVADRELAMVALQYGDLSAKVAAIREYNKVKKRITDVVEIYDPQVKRTKDEILQELKDRGIIK